MVSNSPKIVSGQWHPPGSSRSVHASLLERADHLIICGDTGDTLASGNLSSLEISSRVGRISRRITFPDGSLFETADNDAIDRFLAEKGRSGKGLIHRLERFRPRLIAFVAAAILLAILIYRTGLPLLVEVAIAVTPPPVSSIMSTSTLETLDRTLLDESELDEERRQNIAQGFSRLAAQSARGEAAYTLYFRKGDELGPNAFALPDGTVILTDELVKLAGEDTEMILGVLGHEIGHVEHKDGLRQIYRAAGAAALIMLIAGDIGSGTEDLLVQGSALLALSYSRSAEAQADRYSVELMAKAGFDPAAIARFFELLEKKLGDRYETSILSTHPSTPQRRKAILKWVGEFEERK